MQGAPLSVAQSAVSGWLLRAAIGLSLGAGGCADFDANRAADPSPAVSGRRFGPTDSSPLPPRSSASPSSSELAGERVAATSTTLSHQIATRRGEPVHGPDSQLSSATLPPYLDPERILVATAAQVFVYERPDVKSPKLGYLRSGGVVSRSARSVSGKGCAGEFYAIEPHGFVCSGTRASIDAQHPLLQVPGARPNRDSVLPYVYGRSRYPAPPFYSRVPTAREQRRVEQELGYHKQNHAGSEWQSQGVGMQPPFLLDGAPSLLLNGRLRSERELSSGRAVANSAFGLLHRFNAHRRLFGLTTSYEVIPLDRLDLVKSSAFQGVELRGERMLPLAFVRGHHVALFRRTSGGVEEHRLLSHREPVFITGEKLRAGGQSFWWTRDGLLLPDTSRTVVVPRRNTAPSWASPGRTWVDISILSQTLVAYEGEIPVYATLVSTGKDGLAEASSSKATIQGRFLIHTKHVTSSMGSSGDDVFDLRDVPYVQYFKDGYALHAAYWHDSFGHPRSHGCINLSPRDARWLFAWSEPAVPRGWHGAMSLLQGTLVSAHP